MNEKGKNNAGKRIMRYNDNLCLLDDAKILCACEFGAFDEGRDEQRNLSNFIALHGARNC